MNIEKRKTRSTSTSFPQEKQKTYQEIITFLDASWSLADKANSAVRMKQINALFDQQKLPTILITGAYGKTVTTHYAVSLLQREQFSVCSIVTPHIKAYNERICYNGTPIDNETFTFHANNVLSAVHAAGIKANSAELLLQIALNYFHNKNADIIVVEAMDTTNHDPTTFFTPHVVALTRIEPKVSTPQDYCTYLNKGAFFTCADQNKAHLKELAQLVKQHDAQWAMPIRKLAPLPYPFEQLHGRWAALAERAVSLFVNNFVTTKKELLSKSLLIKQAGTRGRPTLQEKKKREKEQKETITDFWSNYTQTSQYYFSKQTKNNTTFLYDTFESNTGLEQFLLGIRLLNYEAPFKTSTLIFGFQQDSIDLELFSKQIRYFNKKLSTTIILCTPTHMQKWQKQAWNHLEAAVLLKHLKVKVKTATTIEEALTQAKKITGQKNSVIAVGGTSSLLASLN